MITRDWITKAYLFLRENNHNIPDEVLDFILNSSLDKLEELNRELKNLKREEK